MRKEQQRAHAQHQACPLGRLPPSAQATDGQSHGTPTALRKESCKIPSRWHRHRHLPLKQRFSKLRDGHENQVSIWPCTCCYRPTPGLSFPICKLRGCFLTHVLRFDSLFTFQKAFSTGDHNLQTIFTGSHPTSKMLERQKKKKNPGLYFTPFHITDEPTKAQRGQMTHPGPSGRIRTWTSGSPSPNPVYRP